MNHIDFTPSWAKESSEEPFRCQIASESGLDPLNLLQDLNLQRLVIAVRVLDG